MAHYGKYTKASVGGLTKHYERAKGENGEYLRFKNEGIDLTRSHLNYNLAPHQKDQREFINERLGEVFCLKRDNVKVMCDWVLTVPKTVPEWHQREFFERAYQFLEEKYGRENVISAYVHMDETTPHMHFAFIPVVHDLKKDRDKVSAKEAVTREDLRTFHTELQAVMDDFVAEHDFFFACDVLNGATDNGNLTVQGLKAEQMKEDNLQTQAVLDEMMIQVNDMGAELQELEYRSRALKKEVEHLERLKTDMESDLDALEERIDKLQSSEMGLIERFLNDSRIKPIFEAFCQRVRAEVEQRKLKREEMAQQRAERGSLDWSFFKKGISEERKSTPTPTVDGYVTEKSGKKKSGPEL